MDQKVNVFKGRVIPTEATASRAWDISSQAILGAAGPLMAAREQTTAKTLKENLTLTQQVTARPCLFSAPQVGCLQLGTARLRSPAHPPTPFCPFSKVCASVLQPSPWLALGPTQVRRSKSPSHPQWPLSKVRTLARAQLAKECRLLAHQAQAHSSGSQVQEPPREEG